MAIIKTLSDLQSAVNNENETTWEGNPLLLTISGRRGAYVLQTTPRDPRLGSWADEVSIFGNPEEVWASYQSKHPQKLADKVWDKYGSPITPRELKKFINKENRSTFKGTGVRLGILVEDDSKWPEHVKFQLIAQKKAWVFGGGVCWVVASEQGTARRALLSYENYYKYILLNDLKKEEF